MNASLGLLFFSPTFSLQKWSSQLSRHLRPCMYTWGDRREWRIVRQSSIHFSQEQLWAPIQEPPRGLSIGLSVGQDSTPAHNFAFWVKLLGPCFPNGALTVVLLTSDVGKGDGIPFPNVRALGSCIVPAPSAAGAVTPWLSRGLFDLYIFLTLHSWKKKEQQFSPLAKSHLLVEVVTFNLRKVNISSVKRCVG